MVDEQLEQIEGVVEDIIYENEDNGYVVFEISGGGVLTVVCGIVGELHAGESVICRGRYENHATYGRQFHAQECETDMPKDLEAVYAFLASRSLPYIGAKTADKIIDMFGAEALEVIANDPARLTKIPGISPDKADRIQQEFKRMFGMRELIAYLAQFEISPRKAMEVFKAFGVGAMQAIASNPYLLCGEPLQLDFRHADSIAQYYHMEGDCASLVPTVNIPERVSAPTPTSCWSTTSSSAASPCRLVFWLTRIQVLTTTSVSILVWI